MSTRGEIAIGEERCLRLERHKIKISVDLQAGDAHVRVYDDAGELLSHLAILPPRARRIARRMIEAADRADPAGASLLLVDVAGFDTARLAALRALLDPQPQTLEAVK